MRPTSSGARRPSVIPRLLSAAAVGVAHFAMTLTLGPSIHCTEARGCHANDSDAYASFFAALSIGSISSAARSWFKHNRSET